MQDKYKASPGNIVRRLMEMKAPEMGAYLYRIGEELAESGMPNNQETKKTEQFIHSETDSPGCKEWPALLVSAFSCFLFGVLNHFFIGIDQELHPPVLRPPVLRIIGIFGRDFSITLKRKTGRNNALVG